MLDEQRVQPSRRSTIKLPHRFSKENLRLRLVRRLVGERAVIANVRVNGAHGADLINMAGKGICHMWGVTSETTPPPPPTIQHLSAPSRHPGITFSKCSFKDLS